MNGLALMLQSIYHISLIEQRQRQLFNWERWWGAWVSAIWLHGSDSSCILYIDHCQLGGRGTTEVFNSDVLIDTNLESSSIFQIEITALVYYAT